MSTALHDYMERENVSDAAFSEVIERDRSIVSRLRRGKMMPTLEIAAKIEEATKGRVPMDSWLKTKRKRGDKAGVPA